MDSEVKGHYVLKTLGCKANFYDSQILESEFQKRSWAPLNGGASEKNSSLPVICVVNSCTVTDEADRQSRKMAARLFRDNPKAKVVITGCSSEVDPERLTRSKGIHYVIGNRDKPALVDLMIREIESEPHHSQAVILGATSGPHGYEELKSQHPLDREWPQEGVFGTLNVDNANRASRKDVDKTRAFLKIQEGCNSFCTYCIIPYGRGPSRSLRPREVIDQIKALVAQGVREVVITGTNIGDYGSDWSLDKANVVNDEPTRLFEMIFSETDLERLRVSSLDPTEITEAMLKLMARQERFCPHFHVSLQSPHSKILRLMKRRYGFEQVKDCLLKIAAIPRDIFVGMDIITGFPGETLEDFEWGVQRLSELPWTRLHVFPYSEREGTPATRLKGVVPAAERSRRARVLFQLSFERMKLKHQEFLRAGGLIQGVLLERAGRAPQDLPSEFKSISSWQAGYTANYLRVFLPETPGSRNSLVAAQALHLTLDAQNGDVALIGIQR